MNYKAIQSMELYATCVMLSSGQIAKLMKGAEERISNK